MNIRCIIIDDEPIARRIIRDFISKINELVLIAEFEHPIEAIPFINNNKTDLMFLDINMPEINGIDFAKSLPNPPSIIFTTAYRQYAAEGFDLHAVDYLVKPISFERFLKAFNHYLLLHNRSKEEQINQSPGKPEDDFIMLKDNKKTHKINLDEIKYIESNGDYNIFYLHNRKLMIRGSLSSMEKLLSPSLFLRIHNSFIINLKKVNAITPYSVEIDGIELPISRSRKESVFEIIKV